MDERQAEYSSEIQVAEIAIAELVTLLEDFKLEGRHPIHGSSSIDESYQDKGKKISEVTGKEFKDRKDRRKG